MAGCDLEAIALQVVTMLVRRGACVASWEGALGLRERWRQDAARAGCSPPTKSRVATVIGLVGGDVGVGLGCWEQGAGGRFGVEDEVEEADHHFVPALLAPDDGFGGVGIFGIVGGVVEVRGAFDLGALGQIERRVEVVPELPAPIVFGDAQQRFGAAVGIDDAVFEIFAARVHVRMQAGELYVGEDVESGVDFVIRIAGRNFECAVDGGKRKDAFLRRLFGEDEPIFV